MLAQMMTKHHLVTTILDLIFYIWLKRILKQFLSFRKTDCDKLESLCVIHY